VGWGNKDFNGNVPQLPEVGDPAGAVEDRSVDFPLDGSVCGRLVDVCGSVNNSDKWGESRLEGSGSHHRVVSRF